MARVYHTTPNETAAPVYKLTQLVWFLFWLVAVFLLFRFFLRLAGANPVAAFTDFIYDSTDPLVSPFANAILPTRTDTGVAEWSTLLALVVYYLVAWALARLFYLSKPVTSTEGEHRLEEHHRRV